MWLKKLKKNTKYMVTFYRYDSNQGEKRGEEASLKVKIYISLSNNFMIYTIFSTFQISVNDSYRNLSYKTLTAFLWLDNMVGYRHDTTESATSSNKAFASGKLTAASLLSMAPANSNFKLIYKKEQKIENLK